MDLLMTKLARHFKANKLLGAVYAANILISFHEYILIYINSSFLSEFFSASQISVLYIVGSAICVFLLLNISRILEHISTYSLIVFLICIEAVAAFGLAFSVSPTLI